MFSYFFPLVNYRQHFHLQGRSGLHLQGNNVCVGCLDCNTERVLPVTVHRMLVCPSLEEQADLAAQEKGKTINRNPTFTGQIPFLTTIWDDPKPISSAHPRVMEQIRAACKGLTQYVPYRWRDAREPGLCYLFG